MLARDVEAANVVQRPVVRLADERVHGPHLLIAPLGDRPGDDRLHGRADGERVRQHDRRLDRAELLHLRRSGKLPEGVPDEDRARHFLLKQVAAVREDRGDARADVVALDDRRVPDADAGHVGDRVQRTRRPHAGRDA